METRPGSQPGLTVARLQRLARLLQGAVRSDLAIDFLNATSALPWVQPRKLYQDPETKALYPSSAIATLPAERRWKLVSRTFEERDFYEGRYGQPIAYAAFVDALAELGVASLSGKSVIDIGYASILQLRLMACLGARVVGLETDRFPHALYGFEGDCGPVRPVRGRTIDRSHEGSVQLVRGRFGTDWSPPPATVDLLLSRNTLKQGYVHPHKDHSHEPNVRLGLSDKAFLDAARQALAKGGIFAIYNTFDPRDTGPGADGTSPFAAEQFAQSGFELMHFNHPDDARFRSLVDILRTAGTELAGTVAAEAPRALFTAARAV